MAVCGILRTAAPLQLYAADNKPQNKILKVYSVFPDDLTQALLDEYKEETKTEVSFRLLSASQAAEQGSNQPDIYLIPLEQAVMLTEENKLRQTPELKPSDYAQPLYNKEGYWTAFCYDPYLFLVNFAFSRERGQKNLSSWADLVRNEDLTISIEDLSSTQEMRYFLSALAAQMGEEEALSYLKKLNTNVKHYAKFPISPIRLVTIGEVDVAVTSRNKVTKYIENNFPAYLRQPAEGYPAKIFAVGVGRATTEPALAGQVGRWLLQSQETQVITERLGYGYLFLAAQIAEDKGLKGQELWVDDFYLTDEMRTELVNKWLQNVRFAVR